MTIEFEFWIKKRDLFGSLDYIDRDYGDHISQISLFLG